MKVDPIQKADEWSTPLPGNISASSEKVRSTKISHTKKGASIGAGMEKRTFGQTKRIDLAQKYHCAECFVQNIFEQQRALVFVLLYYRMMKSLRRHSSAKSLFRIEHVIDFGVLADVLDLRELREAINESGFREYANFIDGLSAKQLDQLTDLHDHTENVTFRNVSYIFRESDDSLFSSKTKQFQSLTAIFSAKFKELVAKYSDAFRMSVGGFCSNYMDKLTGKGGVNCVSECPCRLCLNLTCVDMSKEFMPKKLIVPEFLTV
ncbi:hypothetical protein Ddc_15389 [Ditylenchus destructor]|nr:hypothetical protein Ddc_15389 [Ditylenchus destructor]